MAAPKVSLEHARRPTPEERSVLCAALPLGNEPARLTAADARSVDWTFLLTYARQHLTLPLLARAGLASAPFAEALPDAVREALEDSAAQNELQNRQLLADLAAAVGLLRRHGIASIPLKGAGLLAQYPALVRTRHTDDIDLWVEPARVQDAHALLRESGYTDLGARAAVALYDGSMPLPRQLGGDFYELPCLVSPRGTPLEIHRRPPTAGRAAAWGDALRATVPIEVHGETLRVRDATATLRDLSGHVVVHHRAVPWLWPRHLVDVAQVLDGHPERMATALAGARLGDRASLLLTSAVLAEMQPMQLGQAAAGAPAAGPQGRLARRLVFPFGAQLGWGVYRLVNMAFENLRVGPRAFARALWPSDAFLESRGFDPARGAWKAHAAHLRDVLARARSR